MPEPPEGPAGAATRADGAWLLRRAMVEVVGGAIDAALSGRGDGRQLLVADIGGRSSPWRARVESLARRAGRPIRHVTVDLDPRATVRGVAEALPLRSESADLVLCTQMLEHVRRPEAAVAEMRRVVHPDGVCLLTTHGTWFYHPDPEDYWRWTAAGLRALFTGAGFPRVEVTPVGGTKLALATLALTSIGRAAGDGLAGAALRGLVVAPANTLAAPLVLRRLEGRRSVEGELAINYLVRAEAKMS
jgi:SAM-dependent methyltransferase